MAAQQFQAADDGPIAARLMPAPAASPSAPLLLSTLAEHRFAAPARGAGTLVLALAPFLFALGLKPFAYGIWFQAEPVTVGLLALGAAASLCLVALDATGHAVWPVFRRPPLLLLLTLVGWSAVVSPLQSFPARSWFGAPETGEGIFSLLALLTLAALAWVLWPYRGPRLAMTAGAIISALAIGGLNAAVPAGSPWRPQLLGAYGGLVGPAVAVTLLGATPATGAAGRPRLVLAVLAFLVGLPAVLFSQSKVALLLDGLLAPAACWLVFRLQYRLRPSRRRILFSLGPVMAVAGFALVVAMGMVMPPLNIYAFLPRHLADTLLHFVSAGPTAIDVFYSVRSRGLLALAGFAGLAAHPLAWVTGFGWGSYADVMYRHTFIDGVKGYQFGMWAPSWEGVGAGAFHVHSDPLEAVFSAGLAAGICYVALFCLVVQRSRRAMLPFAAVAWLAIVGQLSEWYPDLLVFPFLALAMAACCAKLRSPPPLAVPAPSGRIAAWIACVAVASVLAFGAQATASDALAGGRLLAALNRQSPADVPPYGSIPSEQGRGGVHLWWAALNYVYFIDTQLSQGHTPTPTQAALYARLLEEVDAATAQGRAGIRLAALTVAIRNDLALNQANTDLAWLRQSELPGWDDAVVNLIRRAPDRTDVAVPDLATLVAGHHYLALLALCNRIFRIHPGDRVCLWYSGVAMITDPLSQQTGFDDLRQALALGVDAVAPVTPAARQAVEAHFAPPRK